LARLLAARSTNVVMVISVKIGSTSTPSPSR
jgi:hypothetical protein